MQTVTLTDPDDFDAWRNAARVLVLGGVEPRNILWLVGSATDLFAQDTAPPNSPTMLLVPRTFVDLARTVLCHRDPQRFALLYTLLWRLQRAPALLSGPADPLVRRIDVLAKAVRRDVHKMRAFVRFREIDGHYVAWFEPDHHIVRINAGFFVRRFAAMRWSILTPELSIHWDGEGLSEAPGAERTDAPDSDPIEAVWSTYYRSIFNPARVKIGAMTREMPKKYWKNMPETASIPALIASAQARESGMIARRSGPTTVDSLAALGAEASMCRRCSLWRSATQTVLGEGPRDAALMFVGEQPGDQEDQAGRPFVGPAGKLFDKALADAGIDRTRAYVTNAVKHFKFEQRGKRRMHAKPGTGEIEACRWWVDQERAILRPSVTVALGATAARSLFRKIMPIGKMRGAPLALPDGGTAFVTVHPSYLLRIDDAQVARQEYGLFVDDLRMIGQALKDGTV